VTAPAPAAPEFQPEQPALSPAEEAVIAALTVFFASKAAIGATFLPAHLVQALVSLGISKRAAFRAGREALAVPMAGRNRHGMPLNLPPTSAGRVVRADEPGLRARYVLNAGRRLTGALIDGRFPAAARDERRWLTAHINAGRRRRKAAQKLDELADAGAGLLRWRTKRDARVTPDCQVLEGQVFTAADPPTVNGRVAIPGAVHPNCLLPGTEVSAPGIRATTTRRYRGEVVELLTSGGDFLAVTPNHPVLTPQGWVAAGLLDEGSQVVRAGLGEALLHLVDPHDHQGPALIEDVVATFGELRGMLPVAVPVTAEDFHGDGFGSEVTVVRSDGMLRDGGNSAQPQPSRIKQFSGDSGRLAVSPLSRGTSSIPRVLHAAHGGVRGFGIADVLLGGPSGHHQSVRRGLVPARDSRVAQDRAHLGPGDAVGLGELVLADPGQVGIADVAGGQPAQQQAGGLALEGRGPVPFTGQERPAFYQGVAETLLRDVEHLGYGTASAVAGLIRVDRVLKVRKRFVWSGHVYNLETSSGWYIANNIIVHNCRCTAVPVAVSPMQVFPVSA
jgi:hypothetical protein